MELPDDISRLTVVGGDLAIDFVNTADSASPDGPVTDDYLTNYAHLVAWAYKVGFVGTDEAARLVRRSRGRPAEARAAHDDALELREVLYEVFRGIATGRQPSSKSVERLQQWHCSALEHARLLRASRRWEWTWVFGPDLRSILWPIVNSATRLLTSDAIGNVKLCHGCRWLFVDTSKNHSRRWCSMAACGNRAKARRFAARRRS